MDRFDADRQKLQMEVVRAIERLANHMGTPAMLLRLDDETLVAIGTREEIATLLAPDNGASAG